MILEFSKAYQKDFDKLQLNKQARVQACLRTFLINPDTPSLRRHALKGEWLGYTSISAGGDLRLLYKEKNDNITFVFVRVSTHSDLFG